MNARFAMMANGVDEGPAAKEQKNKAQGLSRLSRRDLSDFVPKGLEDSARAESFRPWKHVHRPLRGEPFFNRHLGLKPQAESFSPFGTQDHRELQPNNPTLRDLGFEERRAS